jgi:signal peptidase I
LAKKEKEESSFKRELISWAKTIAFAVVFAAVVNNVVIVNATVPTGSMENNIMPKDRIIAFRLSYVFSKPKRFDIVVFRFPDDRSELYVKRIIGLPGDTIEIRGGKVFVNGSDDPLQDDFSPETPRFEDAGPYTVPEGSYFMLGDNRNNSADSRVWKNTFVVESDILGKVIFKYFPGVKMLYNI